MTIEQEVPKLTQQLQQDSTTGEIILKIVVEKLISFAKFAHSQMGAESSLRAKCGPKVRERTSSLSCDNEEKRNQQESASGQ